MRVWGLLGSNRRCRACGGCTSVYNLPHNQPLTGTVQAPPLGGEVPLSSDDVMMSLAFSGGGTRAAAFSFGVLKEIDRTRIRDRGKNVSLLDRVDFVSGVSGGSVLAAYYGLRKREALTDFRERFLLRNAEEVAQHPGLDRQSRPRDRRRPERRHAPAALARRQSVRRRDLPRLRAATGARASGSTRPTSTTARRSCSATSPSTRCAAT